MDDLIILLIRGLARWLGGTTPRQPGAPAAGTPNLPPAWQEQVRRRVAAAKRPVKGPARGRAPALPPIPIEAPVVAVPLGPIRTPAQAAHASTRQAPHAARLDIRQWLTPSVLQKQFILTEVLQPPLALRESK